MTSIDEAIDLSLESTTSCERSLGQLNSKLQSSLQLMERADR
jgi:hypothetical protein